MKTLIVPTDFSPASENAMNYAVQLARQLKADILLTHIYQIPVSMNDMPVILVSAEELKKTADENLERVAQELAKDTQLNIKTESRLGDVGDELDDLCNEVQPLAVVMGSHGASGLERLIFGSTTLSVIGTNDYPIIAVPAQFKNFTLQKVVLAVDLLEGENVPVDKILEFLSPIQADFHVVHVTNKEGDDTSLQSDILLNQLQPLAPSYHPIHHENVRDGLLAYLKEINADLLLLLPHEHNLMERLFFKLHSSDIVKHTSIPVMTIKC